MVRRFEEDGSVFRILFVCHGITKASEAAGGHKFVVAGGTVVDEEGTTVLLRLKKVLAMLDT